MTASWSRSGRQPSAIHEARNGVEAPGRVRESTGVAVTVLPGVEEARLTYVAARRWTAFSARRLLVVDIGGGSLEVAAGSSTGQRLPRVSCWARPDSRWHRRADRSGADP